MPPAHEDDRYRVPGAVAQELVELYGTPLYVIGEEHFRNTIRRYMAAFDAVYPITQVAYASKANGTLALLTIAHEEGCIIDVASEGELRGALAAGVIPSRCHLHGNYKTLAELQMAFTEGLGHIVADNMLELHDIANLAGFEKPPEILLRLAPGVNPLTDDKISTGKEDTKFGFSVSDGSAMRAVKFCVEHNLPLIGYHCHVGSQLMGPEAQIDAAIVLAQLAIQVKDEIGIECKVLNLGGGLAVKYTDEDDPVSVEEYNQRLVEAVTKTLEGSGLQPLLIQEPGRALIASSGVTLYRVGAIKIVPVGTTTKTYVAVDGGIADNPRPALYGSKYTVERVLSSRVESGVTMRATVAGRHCESDVLFPDIDLPVSLQTGDVLQVLSTGAYNSSMSSNYNRYPRPATILIRADGSHDMIQRPETWTEMFQRDFVPEDLR